MARSAVPSILIGVENFRRAIADIESYGVTDRERRFQADLDPNGQDIKMAHSQDIWHILKIYATLWI